MTLIREYTKEEHKDELSIIRSWMTNGARINYPGMIEYLREVLEGYLSECDKIELRKLCIDSYSGR